MHTHTLYFIFIFQCSLHSSHNDVLEIFYCHLISDTHNVTREDKGYQDINVKGDMTWIVQFHLFLLFLSGWSKNDIRDGLFTYSPQQVTCHPSSFVMRVTVSCGTTESSMAQEWTRRCCHYFLWKAFWLWSHYISLTLNSSSDLS